MRCNRIYSGWGSIVGFWTIAVVMIALCLTFCAEQARAHGADPYPASRSFQDRAEKFARDQEFERSRVPRVPMKAGERRLRAPHISATIFLEEDFNAGFPAGWSVIDNEGNGVVWEVPQAGGAGNYTGGTFDAVGANSDAFGTAEFDTELRTPTISGFHPGAVLSYKANYANFGGNDFLDLDISTDGGTNWTNILSWNEDHGGFKGLPGEDVQVSLDPFVAASTDFILRWRYYDPNVADWDWYAMIDDVLIVSDPACPTLPAVDTAVFKIGDPVPAGGGIYDVPLYASVDEDVTFTQMAIEYDSACLTYVLNSVALGGDVGNATTADIFVDVTDVGGTTKRLLLNVTGTFTGCEQEVFTAQFEVTGTAPCDLEWFKTDEGPNSRNHLNYAVNVGGIDGKITPSHILFCDVSICDADIQIMGQVTYYSNGELILDNKPDDPDSEPVTVEDCTMAQTTVADANADYTLSFGHGPQYIELCASRPIAGCGSEEDGVISGDDVISIQDEAGTPPFLQTYTAKQKVAAKGSGDGVPFVTQADVLAVKRWIARKVCDGTDSCGGANDNCVATWRFLIFSEPDPNHFFTDLAILGDVCGDRTINIEGVLVGDVDGSWPEYFVPKANSLVDLAVGVDQGQDGVVTLALNVELDAGESLRHVIYSLEYDSEEFDYIGLEAGAVAPEWPALDNADTPGEAHGIAHRPALTEPLTQSGEVVVFRFRALHPGATSRVSFTRLKANDVDVQVPDLVISADGNDIATPVIPTRYTLSSHPNPFNPRTRVEYTIPGGSGRVPVQLRVYDISGRLVRTLQSVDRGPGRYVVEWDGTSNSGRTAGAGIYLLRIQAGEWSETEKLTLVK